MWVSGYRIGRGGKGNMMWVGFELLVGAGCYGEGVGYLDGSIQHTLGK